MIRPDELDRVPEITVRVPGPWTGLADLAASLPAGVELGPDELRMPDGDRLELVPMPPDDVFPDLFMRSCRTRRHRSLRRQLQAYAVNVCLSRPGGSIEAARAMLRAAAAVIEAGGLGVFVDNSGSVYDSNGWSSLARDGDAAAAVLAFVGVYGNGREIYSVGMHVMGLRDAIMPCSGDPDDDVQMLGGLLGYTAVTPRQVVPGDYVGDGLTRSFLVRGCRRPALPLGAPMVNPYGYWRLVPVGT